MTEAPEAGPALRAGVPRDDSAPSGKSGAHEGQAAAVPPRWLERLGLLLFAAVWGTVMTGLVVLRTRDPEPLHGDAFSDAAHLIAGQNYDRHGLRHHLGLPHFWELGDRPPAGAYITFPPGAYLLIQLYKSMGLSELWQFRAATLVWSGLTGILVMALATRLAGSTFVGSLATLFYMGSAPFLEYADSFAYHSSSQATLAGTLLAWVACEQARRTARRRLWLVLACILCLADGLLTLEHIPFIVAFVGLRALWLRHRRLGRAALWVLLIPPLLLAARFGHVSLALGDVGAVTAQLRSKLAQRAGLDSPEDGYGVLLRTWYRRLGAEHIAPHEYDYPFRYPLLAGWVRPVAGALLIVLLCLGHAAPLHPAGRALRLGLLLAICGSLWLLLMVQHAVIHRHLILLLLPGLALALGALAAAGVLAPLALPRGRVARLAGPLLAVALVGGFIAELRGTMVANRVAAFDPAVRTVWEANRAASERLRGFAQAHPQVRFVFIRGFYPELAWLLGRDFRITGGLDVPRLDPDELFWVQCWGPGDEPVVPAAARRYGLPDMFSQHLGDSNKHLVFWARRAAADQVDIPFEHGLRITRLRVAPAIDGESWYVQALLEGPLQPMPCDELTFYCHLLGADGQALRYADTRVAWGAKDADGVVLWTTLLRDEIARTARLRLGLWCPAGARGPAHTLRLAGAPAGLAGPVEVDESREGFVWRPAAWASLPP